MGNPWLGAMKAERGVRITFKLKMAAAGTSAGRGCGQGSEVAALTCRQPKRQKKGSRLFLRVGHVQLGGPARLSSARRQALWRHMRSGAGPVSSIPAGPISIPQAVRHWVSEAMCAICTAPHGPFARMMLLISEAVPVLRGGGASVGLVSSSEEF